MRVSIHLDEGLVGRIDSVAASEGRTRSGLIAYVLGQAFPRPADEALRKELDALATRQSLRRELVALEPGEDAPISVHPLPPGFREETDSEFRARLRAAGKEVNR